MTRLKQYAKNKLGVRTPNLKQIKNEIKDHPFGLLAKEDIL
jgi:hypothetical protein